MLILFIYYKKEGVSIYSEQTYTIGEFSKLINKSVKTLQRWDRQGILKPFRTPTQRRCYTHTQLLEYNKKHSQFKIIYTNDEKKLIILKEELKKAASQIERSYKNVDQSDLFHKLNSLKEDLPILIDEILKEMDYRSLDLSNFERDYMNFSDD